MSSVITEVRRVSTYEQRLQITTDADDQQESAVASILASGFAFDWQRIAQEVGTPSEPVTVFERAIRDALRAFEFRETVAALRLNGKLIAAHVQHRYESLAGIRGPVLLAFAEPDLSTPEKIVAHWRKILNLTDAQAAALLETAKAVQSEGAAMADRIATALLKKLVKIHGEIMGQSVAQIGLGLPINEGDSLAQFIKSALDMLPDQSKALLETEYRTRLTTDYVSGLHEQIAARANVFPFMQLMVIRDSRTTWWICAPMGKAGPNGTGYIAATGDPIWFVWRPPNHFRCRSALSPVSYREAQRFGILAKDGKTKIAIKGNNPDRPFGDPPKFAEEPGGGKIRRVEPQVGFGA